VALYIAALADRSRKASGIELAVVAISQAHKDNAATGIAFVSGCSEWSNNCPNVCF
jgi:hypothetical protein